MPFYTFKCQSTSCEHEEDKLMSIAAYEGEKHQCENVSPSFTCPECGSFLKPGISTGSTFKINGSNFANGYT